MLFLHRITVENFGPFKGIQTIDFPPEPGVVLIYGENMRGKTTLLNAIRYAFYGYVRSRGDHEIDLAKIGNWEAAAEGVYGFRVVLEFDYKGTPYELTRQCRPRPGITTPVSSLEYAQDTLLRCGADVLGPEQRDRILAQVLPEKISRFFLFDGELLQQYEELLREESNMGRQIKESIERILGVPVLTNARADMRELYRDAQGQEGKAAQRDQRTREFGNHHQALIDERTCHESELLRLAGEREALYSRWKAIEDALKKSERLKALLSERDALQNDIIVIDQKVTEKRARIRDLMVEAWRWLLHPQVHDLIRAMEVRIEVLRAKETEFAVASEKLKATDAAIDSGSCDSCKRPLDPETLITFRTRADSLRALLKEKVPAEEFTALLHRLATLKEFLAPDHTAVLKELNLSLDDLRVERATKLDRIEEIQEQTRNIDESEIRKLSSDHERIGQEIAILDQGIQGETRIIQELTDSIRRVQNQLDRLGGADLAKERRRRETCEHLLNLFDQAVGEYRDRLRSKVEEDATSLFLRLTTESDYLKLKINENYGLTIIHKDGVAIPVRSAGAEHIVALSLMGALQRNAPLRGPIIMDSPFGRLDQGHTTRVVRSLPCMADQVLLLVYEAELEPRLARNELMAQLKGEYKLVRKSARHSVIQPYTE